MPYFNKWQIRDRQVFILLQCPITLIIILTFNPIECMNIKHVKIHIKPNLSVTITIIILKKWKKIKALVIFKTIWNNSILPQRNSKNLWLMMSFFQKKILINNNHSNCIKIIKIIMKHNVKIVIFLILIKILLCILIKKHNNSNKWDKIQNQILSITFNKNCKFILL